jgi:membrane protease YdiL (CAAX protease family)
MDQQPPQSEPLTHSQFLIGAGLFEGGLLLIALLLGALVDVRPTGQLTWSLTDLGLGLVATAPMLLMLAAGYLSSSKGIRQIREFLREAIGPFLDQCRLIDLFLLAVLAGVCEEILFRGFLYEWIRGWNPPIAILFTNLLFGLAHSITPLYAMLAALIGLYLTALMSVGSSPNLLIPVTAHTTYDFIAFLVVLWDYRRIQRANTQP